MVRLQ